MTSWIFDNVGMTTPLEIATEVKRAGGKIEDEAKLRKLEKGGVVVIIDSESAPITMCKIADWCAARKIRSHLPKTMLRGTVRLIIKNLPSDYEAEEVAEALRNEGLEILDMYMFKNANGYTTGTVKVTVKGSDKVRDWLEKERGEVKGVRIQVERQRSVTKCFNCNKIGHRIADCQETTKCKKCGQEGHLKATCTADPGELATKCGYCFEGGHSKSLCQAKREDEKKERENFKKEKKDPELKNPWHKQQESEQENKEGKDEMMKEMKKTMKEELDQMQMEMMKTMMNSFKEMMSTMMENDDEANDEADDGADDATATTAQATTTQQQQQEKDANTK